MIRQRIHGLGEAPTEVPTFDRVCGGVIADVLFFAV